MHSIKYSETPLMRTPLGPSQSVLIRGMALYFRGCFNVCRIFSGTARSVRITVDVRISGVSARRGSTVFNQQSITSLYASQRSVYTIVTTPSLEINLSTISRKASKHRNNIFHPKSSQIFLITIIIKRSIIPLFSHIWKSA